MLERNKQVPRANDANVLCQLYEISRHGVAALRSLARARGWATARRGSLWITACVAVGL